MSTRGSVVRTSPTRWSDDATTLTTPAGMSVSSAMSRPSTVADHGVSGAGLSTTVLPAARAGPSLARFRLSGKFHGVMAPTTPTASRRTSRRWGWPNTSRSGSQSLVLVAHGLVDPVPQVVDGQVDLVDVGERDGAAHLGHGDGAQLLDVGRRGGVELLEAAAPEARGPSTSRSRRRPGGPRRWPTSMSAAVPSAVSPSTSSVVGSMLSNVAPARPRRACRR